MKKFGFTLAEVLITLAIIGVVAALTIPSVVANTQQQEFKTGLKKAVSVLNSAITMNMAIDGETPYENRNLYRYLARHMSVMKNDVLVPTDGGNTNVNIAFYTTDGMRFEFVHSTHISDKMHLYENKEVNLRASRPGARDGGNGNVLPVGDRAIGDCIYESTTCSYCGSYGLNDNHDNTVNAPCLVVVDVNGDRKPFPKNAACYQESCSAENVRKYADPTGKKLTDTFPIMITDKKAIPYGIAAQKAMYEAQK